jgi:HK97 family phage portal protein
LPSDKTSPVWFKDRLMYATTATKTGVAEYMEAEDVLHIPGLTMDGYVGLSPIRTCKNAFGLAIAAEKFGAQFFGNGARTSGVLTHPGQLDTEAFENLKKSLREQMSNENAMRPLVLEEGMTWTQASVAPDDAQFLETRQFQRSEIAALYRVPLHLLQDLQRSTNNNIEHQALDYIRYALRPWAIRLEQEINRKLLSGNFYCEHDFNDFQRGDFASQTQGFQLLRNAGVYSTNDVLKALRQNPISAEEGGDVRLAPLNMVNLATLVGPEGPEQPQDQSEPGEAITDIRRERIVATYRRLFRDAVGRVVNRKGADSQFVYRAFQPIVAAMAEAVWAMHLPGEPKLSDVQGAAIQAHLDGTIAASSSWTKETASDVSTALTDAAYTAIRAAILS